MARRLKTIAKWINENLPELEARIDTMSERPYRKGGRIIVWQGKTRTGNRLTVIRRKTGQPLLRHSSVETYRSNDEVERWVELYVDGCRKGEHSFQGSSFCWTCGHERDA